MNWHMTRLHRSPKIEYRHTKEGGLCALHQRVTLIAGKLNATCNWECQYASAQADPATCLRVIACTLSFILALHVYELGTRWRSAMSFDRAANASGKLVKIYLSPLVAMSRGQTCLCTNARPPHPVQYAKAQDPARIQWSRSIVWGDTQARLKDRTCINQI